MKTSIIWVLAVLITVATAVYQRMTGPTYPVSGTVQLDGQTLNYKFNRSHGGESDHIVSLTIADTNVTGILFWKRYKTADEFTKVNMTRKAEILTAALPHQPPAGKLEYFVELFSSNEQKVIPKDNSVVIRFKGDVPIWVIIPHVIAMFVAMLMSTRTGLEFFSKNSNYKKLTYLTLGFLFVGGFILGPIMQKFAFGEFWTGIPFGHDLTDNKTLIAFLGWLGALFMYSRSKKPKLWVLVAAIILMVVYMIPHSALGSEIDYNKLDKQKNEIHNLQGDL